MSLDEGSLWLNAVARRQRRGGNHLHRWLCRFSSRMPLFRGLSTNHITHVYIDRLLYKAQSGNLQYLDKKVEVADDVEVDPVSRPAVRRNGASLILAELEESINETRCSDFETLLSQILKKVVLQETIHRAVMNAVQLEGWDRERKEKCSKENLRDGECERC
ncbi:hypothetical protein T07_12450 [Trichinella nelsoni]|uniref:Uncharacterized protein n=1 Tax=Trichinella nelsoni TaxID=6336 RepID=A0A0V0RLA3_9BILA|nr:hypothetical protein T07_12450 [Trichinella nelsoni]